MKALMVGCSVSIFLLFLALNLSAESVRGLKVAVSDKQGEQVYLYNESHALLIGVSDYTAGWADLNGVKEDIPKLDTALVKQGFNVITIMNPTKAELENAIASFISKYGRDEDNRLLIYYSGHGYTLTKKWGGNMGYIVPADAPNPATDQNGFMDKAIDMVKVEGWAKNIDSKHALFMFDSCFSGSLFSLSKAAPAIISYKTANPVRQFITAGGADETVPDKSIFCQQFLDALNGEGDVNGDGYITGSELGEYLQSSVVNYSYNAQHPQYGKIRDRNLDKGDFVFVTGRMQKSDMLKKKAPPLVLQNITAEVEDHNFPQKDRNDFIGGSREDTSPESSTFNANEPNRLVSETKPLYPSKEVSEALEWYHAFKSQNGNTLQPIDEEGIRQAYIYAKVLSSTDNQLAEALAVYDILLKSKLQSHPKRQIQAETGNLLVVMAEHSRGEARNGYLSRAKQIANELLWVQDAWFGKAIAIHAHVNLLEGNTSKAIDLIDDYAPQLLAIDDALKSQSTFEKDLTKLSPIAEVRYVIAVIMQEAAEKMTTQGGDKSEILILLIGDKKTKKTGALQHFLNVSLRYSNSEWADDAAARAKAIVALLDMQYGLKVTIPSQAGK